MEIYKGHTALGNEDGSKVPLILSLSVPLILRQAQDERENGYGASQNLVWTGVVLFVK